MLTKKSTLMKKQVKLLKSNRYQNSLEASNKSSDFKFDCIHLYLYKCHKINPNCYEPYVDSCN